MAPALPAPPAPTNALPAPPPRLLDRLTDALRSRGYVASLRRAYVDWVRRYILFHGKRHPQDAKRGRGQLSYPNCPRPLFCLFCPPFLSLPGRECGDRRYGRREVIDGAR